MESTTIAMSEIRRYAIFFKGLPSMNYPGRYKVKNREEDSIFIRRRQGGAFVNIRNQRTEVREQRSHIRCRITEIAVRKRRSVFSVFCFLSSDHPPHRLMRSLDGLKYPFIRRGYFAWIFLISSAIPTEPSRPTGTFMSLKYAAGS